MVAKSNSRENFVTTLYHRYEKADPVTRREMIARGVVNGGEEAVQWFGGGVIVKGMSRLGLFASNAVRAEVRVGGEGLRFKSTADPLFDTLGHASKSHPEEYKTIMSNLEEHGVVLITTDGAIAFSPNVSGGPLGNLINLPKDFSISALRHEYGHFLDHQALNYPRYIEYFKNPELIIKTERKQYLSEIRFAREIGDQNARKILIQNYLNEKNYIINNYYQQPYGHSEKYTLTFGGGY